MSLTIDGKIIEFEQGQNILQVALANGIEIPNLCYTHYLEPYGGCGLCLVEIEGRPKAVRACATLAEDGMVINTRTPAIIKSREMALKLILSDHRGDCRPPCRNTCPANNDCQGYIGLIANGRYAEAIRLIKEDNPLPASIGRICPHPCEDECRRRAKSIKCWPLPEACSDECNEICHRELAGQPLSIAKLKQFAGDWDLAQEQQYQPPMAEKSGKKVAIVGSGPAGLSAAYFLLRLGHEVEMFESMPKAGGMLRYGIPQYRLPKDVLDKEIALIENMGLKINYHKCLGRDITIAKLKEAYDAVFLAIGAWKSSALGCEGENLPGVYGGLEFLLQAAQNQVSCQGEKVAVVGGGNTAIDAARTALRLGASHVDLLYRRTNKEMPAAKWEVKEADQEGVWMRFLTAPTKVIEENGRAVGLTLQKMKLGEPDASGRPRPVPIEGAVDDVRYDRIIAAIGQKVAVDGLDNIELSGRKTIVVDEGTYCSNLPGVFAGGDAVNKGPDIAISAIAHGKNAAKVIDSYLAGEIRPVINPFLVVNEDYEPKEIAPHKLANRVKPAYLPAHERKHTFDEVTLPFTEYEAQQEASRCLECGCHDLYECKLLPLLQEYNPQGKVFKGEVHINARETSQPTIWRNMNKCILCGLCINVCRHLVQAEALSYWGRGFDTQAAPPYMMPLKDSDCVGCGACVSFCPTGAITLRWPLGKTPPLPTEKVQTVCPYCPEACPVQLSYYGDWLVSVEPTQGKICSLGRWGLVLDHNGVDINHNPVAPSEEALLDMIYKHIELYQGEFPKVENLEQLVDVLRQFKEKNKQ
ncbi:MAG: FAD-dependent oxidoreductase [Bacillota bacterium]|jgi:formate dehydrogenase major subunit